MYASLPIVPMDKASHETPHTIYVAHISFNMTCSSLSYTILSPISDDPHPSSRVSLLESSRSESCNGVRGNPHNIHMLSHIRPVPGLCLTPSQRLLLGNNVPVCSFQSMPNHHHHDSGITINYI